MLNQSFYDAETWRITDQDMKKVSVFHNNCLMRICKVFWPIKISNDDLFNRTSETNMENEICKRRWRWIGHILRKEMGNTTKTALRWPPEGKRKHC